MIHRRLPFYHQCLCLAVAVAALAAISLATPKSATALTLKGQWWSGVGVANINHAASSNFGWWGPSFQTGVVLDVHDFWRLTADVQASHHFPRIIDDQPTGPHTVVSTAVGLRYTFDIIQYVPYTQLSFVAHPLSAPSSGSPEGELFSLRGTVGLDYRYNRRLSFGTAADLHAPLTQPTDFPHYSSVRIHIGLHFHRR